MLSKFKRIIVLVVAFVLVAFSADNAYAVSDERIVPGIQPVGSTYISNARASLTISSGGVAKPAVAIIGKAGTTKVTATMKLQRYDIHANVWADVKTWNGSSNSSALTMNKSYSLPRKGSYRCWVTARVYYNSNSETVTTHSGSVEY